jgi:uncharacterized spore protein YtfJ
LGAKEQEVVMPDVEQIAKSMLGEIERLLDTKKVVGEPIVAGDSTLIPLVSLGFGLGVGSGQGKDAGKREGGGGASGAGGGIKPVAVIVITKEGVRVEPIKRRASPVLEKLVEAIGKATQKRGSETSE